MLKVKGKKCFDNVLLAVRSDLVEIINLIHFTKDCLNEVGNHRCN